ncbi:hypothetical protein HDK77DRAFT_463208 [Phyllosticta capitalensis]
MPTYLLHGFRWPRNLIRIHIILQNLDDAAAEWLMAPATTKCLAENLKTLHPQLLSALPKLRFIEQFDPEIALSTPGGNVQPYAYVADVVEEVRLGVEVGEVMSRGVGNEAWAALTELRDQIAPGERVGWFVVVCQDTERHAPKVNADGELVVSTPKILTGKSTTSVNSTGTARDAPPMSPRTSGVRKWFNGLGNGLGVPLKKARRYGGLR